jgi:hypothetical protein
LSHLVQGSRLFHRRRLHLHASVAFIGVTFFALHGARTDDLSVRRVTALAVRLLGRLVNVDEGAGHQRRDEDVCPGSEPSVGVSDRTSAVRATAAVNAPPTNAPTPSSPFTSKASFVSSL